MTSNDNSFFADPAMEASIIVSAVALTPLTTN